MSDTEMSDEELAALLKSFEDKIAAEDALTRDLEAYEEEALNPTQHRQLTDAEIKEEMKKLQIELEYKGGKTRRHKKRTHKRKKRTYKKKRTHKNRATRRRRH